MGRPVSTHLRRLVAVSLAGLIVPLASASPASAATSADVALNVLVLSDGSPGVEAIADRLTTEGQPVTRLDLTDASRATITADFLATINSSGTHGRFDGVVLPSAVPDDLDAAELQLLHDYEASFKVREIDSYNWANPTLGLNYPAFSGGVDGLTATVTPAGLSGPFSYLAGQFPLDDVSSSVTESYGYLATGLDDTFTPLVTAPIPGTSEQGSLIGVHTDGGREQLVITFAFNAHQQHAQVLTHGLITWLTRGISLTYSRNYFSAHIDDVLLPDGLWNSTGNCTVGDDCDAATYPETAPDATVRMTPSDVSRLLDWQNTNGIALDMVFNGYGATEQKDATGSDALESALLANKSSLRWVNHTWSHLYLGCTQNFTTSPWSCATTSTGATKWMSATDISMEISQNKTYATLNGLPNYSGAALVTGEHSGLKTLPQMPKDNPNLATALNLNGIKWVASDASREKDIRKIGGATTVPRYPMNIYYNTATKAQAVDEYNWIYDSTADGGSGKCEILTDVMTCQPPLTDDAAGFATIADREARTALSHTLGNDPRPHYAHQSNLAGDGVLYPVLDKLLGTYHATFADNTPLVNPTMSEAGGVLVAQSDWRAQTSSISGVVSGSKVMVKNSSINAIKVPLTLPAGSKTLTVFGTTGSSYGSAYAGEQSDRPSVLGWTSKSYQYGSASGFATTVTWPAVAVAPAATVAAKAPTTSATTTTAAPMTFAGASTDVVGSDPIWRAPRRRR